ncbi:hypothetical protein G6F37_005707 [Rhizopus arrhizus]|nr:hypothetical protein G6F37_005707 [Rhizopus arrhizus]
MLKYASYSKRTLPYGNNLLQSPQSQITHLLHLDTSHRQPLPTSLIALSSHLNVPSPSNISPPPPKVAKPKRDNSQPRLTAIVRQFSSPAEPTGFKPIHVSVRRRLSLQQLRSNLCRNLVSFLIYIGYETELRSQLCKFNITVCDDFDPLDPSIIRDPTLVNEPIDCKRFRTPIYNAVANFFVQSGLIDLDDLASYDLAPSYKYSTEHILDHV